MCRVSRRVAQVASTGAVVLLKHPHWATRVSAATIESRVRELEGSASTFASAANAHAHENRCVSCILY